MCSTEIFYRALNIPCDINEHYVKKGGSMVKKNMAEKLVKKSYRFLCFITSQSL